MAAYRRVDDLRSPAGWLPVHRDQLRAQCSVSSMGSLYLYLFLRICSCQYCCLGGTWPMTLFVGVAAGWSRFVEAEGRQIVLRSSTLQICLVWYGESFQRSHKPGIVRKFCTPGKVREFEIRSGNFFITCHMVCSLLIDELIFACNV